jgi:hypothetical protein
LIIYISKVFNHDMSKQRVGIQPFSRYRDNYYQPVQLKIERWLIHALANFEHHRKSTFFDEILRLAAFSEDEKTIATSMITSAVQRQLLIVNMNFCAFVSDCRQQMLDFALSLNKQKAYALWRSFSQPRMPCGPFLLVDLESKQRRLTLVQSSLRSFLAHRLVFDQNHKVYSNKIPCKAVLSIFSRRKPFKKQEYVKHNPFSIKVVGCILPLAFEDNGSLKLVRSYYDKTDHRCRSADHPSLPFRFKCEPDNTVNVYLITNDGEILVLSIPFMQQIN